MSARTAAATPGYWTLTATSRPSCSVARYTCPIEAAAIGSSSKDANTSPIGCFQVVLDHPPHLLERHRRRGVAELGQLALELLAVLLLHQADVQERHHLAELHRRALHRPQRRHDLLRGLQLPARQRLFGGLLPARHVRRARPELLDGLVRGQLAHRRGAAHARGGKSCRCLAGPYALHPRRLPRPVPRPRCGVSADVRGCVAGAVARAQPRWTFDPGTMSSAPVGQRTQAFLPPS